MGISKTVYDYGCTIEKSLRDRFDEVDSNAEYNQLKVVNAMQQHQVSEACLLGTTGYGYNDLGRDTLEAVYAATFHTEDALVRPQITCGTHALALALMSNLRPGDELLSPVGKPYDTLEEVIGIRPSKGSLAEYGVTYRQVDLLPDGSFDYDKIRENINEKTHLVTIQRSKGYQTRPTLSVQRIGELIAFIKGIKPDVICMVDNLRRIRGDHRTFRRGCGYDRRISHQEPRRRTCSYRRIYCWKERMCGKCGIPSDLSGAGQGSRRFPWHFERFLSGIFPGSHGDGGSTEGCDLCSQCL